MPRVQWDTSGTRVFETGIDRGMLYPLEGSGVAWNGLTKVSETPAGGSANEYFIDGDQYLAVSSLSEYSSTVEALSSPSEFAPSAGMLRLFPGVFATSQPRKPFGFSYRTLIGSDLEDPGADYKVHIVYNACARTSDITHQTMSDRPNTKSYSWVVTAIPEVINGFRPTAHFVIDSRRVEQSHLQQIENALYGTETTDPYLITPEDIITILQSEIVEIAIVYNGPFLKKMRVSGSGTGITTSTGNARLDKMTISGSGPGHIPSNVSDASGGARMDKMTISGTGAGLMVTSGGPKLKKMSVAGTSAGLSEATGDAKLKKETISGSGSVSAGVGIAERGGFTDFTTAYSTSRQLPLTGWTTNPQAGDILTVVIRVGTSTAQTWGQSGGSTWTKIAEASVAGSNYSYAVWYRVMQAGDTAPTFTWTSNTYSIMVAQAMKSSDENPLVYDTISSAVNAGSTSSGVNSVDPAAATAAVSDEASLVMVTGRASTNNAYTGWTFTPPSGWTAGANLETQSGNPRIAGWAWKVGVPSGSSDPGSLSWSDSGPGANTYAMTAIQILVRK